jgi:fucose 4-O-acetylase-like acetyltransferase
MHQYNDNHGTDLLIYQMMYSFRMPLFLFVSGFLVIYTTVKLDKYPTFGKFVLKKFKRLLIPLFFLMSLVFIPRALMSGIADDIVDNSWSAYFTMFLHTKLFVIPYYWFLYTSFTLLAITYASVQICRRFKIYLPIALMILIISFIVLYFMQILWHDDFLSIGNTIERGAYFIAGAIYCYYYEIIENKFGQIISSFYFFFVSVVCWTILFPIFEGTNLIMLCSFAGILMSISFAKLLVAKHITILDHLRGSSYIIFLLSWFFNVSTQQVLAHFTNFPWWIYSILSLTTGIYGPWLIYRLLKRYKTSRISQTISFLLGQNTSVS